jgi:hypothetical protein
VSSPTLSVERTPFLDRTLHQVTVECSAKRTRLGLAPPSDEHMGAALPLLKMSVLYRHGSECKACDLEWLWWSEGLQLLREQVDAEWDAMVAEELRGLRN